MTVWLTKYFSDTRKPFEDKNTAHVMYSVNCAVIEKLQKVVFLLFFLWLETLLGIKVIHFMFM